MFHGDLLYSFFEWGIVIAVGVMGPISIQINDTLRSVLRTLC